MRRQRIPITVGLFAISTASAFCFTLINSFGEGYSNHYSIDGFAIDLTNPAHISSTTAIVSIISGSINAERPDWWVVLGDDIEGTFTVDSYLTKDYGSPAVGSHTLGLSTIGRAIGDAFDSLDIILYESTTQTVFGFPITTYEFSPQSLPSTDTYYPFFRNDNPRNGSTASGAYDILWQFDEGATINDTTTDNADRSIYAFFCKYEVDSTSSDVTFTIYDGVQYRFVETSGVVPEPMTMIPLAIGLLYVLRRKR
jgi:hypothetical protein